jgi:TRAP-type C4-dicarboxylate transport system substrate-binding protein
MKTIRWVIAHEPIDLFLRAAERFTKAVREQTNGNLDIEILSLTEYSEKYNNGVKVTKHDLLQLMEDGVVEASQMYTTWLGHYNKDMFVLDMPFLFRDHEHADRVLEGEIGEYLLKGLEQGSAVRGLAFTYSGGYRIIPAQKELATVEAFRGTKIRTARSPVAVDTFKAVGAEVIDTVELEEMNEAVRAGVIEAGESTFVRVIPLKQNEAFGVVEPNSGNPGKDLTQGFAFLIVPAGRPGCVGTDDLDLFGAQTTAGKCQANALGLAFGVGEHKVCRIGVDRVGHDLGDDVGRAFFGI